MTEADAKKIIEGSSAWGNGKEYIVIDFHPAKHTKALYRYDVAYKCKKTGQRRIVPLGVNKMSGAIINCTVDED